MAALSLQFLLWHQWICFDALRTTEAMNAASGNGSSRNYRLVQRMIETELPDSGC